MYTPSYTETPSGIRVGPVCLSYTLVVNTTRIHSTTHTSTYNMWLDCMASHEHAHTVAGRTPRRRVTTRRCWSYIQHPRQPSISRASARRYKKLIFGGSGPIVPTNFHHVTNFHTLYHAGYQCCLPQEEKQPPPRLFV